MIQIQHLPTHRAVLTCGFFSLLASPLFAAPVLMISIDGMKPEYVTQASQHGLVLPTLQRFVSDETYASGVQAGGL